MALSSVPSEDPPEGVTVGTQDEARALAELDRLRDLDEKTYREDGRRGWDGRAGSGSGYRGNSWDDD